VNPDLTHVPPDVPTPPADPRGVKFVAGSNPKVLQWLHEFLGITHPEDVARVQINLEIGSAATVDVKMFLRSNALAELPREVLGTVNIDPTDDQLAAATFAVERAAGVRYDQARAIALAVLKAADPAPEQHPRP
jgi:hypothetical protein